MTSWLQWSNVLQFLCTAGRGFGMLSVTTAPTFPYEDLPVVTGAAYPSPDRAKVPERWQRIMDLADPKVEQLLAALVRRHVEEPKLGLEVDEADGEVLTVELAWPERRVAVVLDDPDAEMRLHDRGWRIFRASECSADELAPVIGRNA